MEAVVLAGGFGTRLKAAVPDLPKPMAPINGEPFLKILLRLLANKGFSRVILSLGYKAEIIKNYFGSTCYGLVIDYVVEEYPLGTGGALKLAFEKVLDDRAFVFNGDTFIDVDINKLEASSAVGNYSWLVGKEVSDTQRYGRIISENTTIIGFSEKGIPGPGLINAGCYLFKKSIFDDFDLGSTFSLEEDVLPKLIDQQSFKVLSSDGLFIDIGIPEDYKLSQELLRAYQQ